MQNFFFFLVSMLRAENSVRSCGFHGDNTCWLPGQSRMEGSEQIWKLFRRKNFFNLVTELILDIRYRGIESWLFPKFSLWAYQYHSQISGGGWKSWIGDWSQWLMRLVLEILFAMPLGQFIYLFLLSSLIFCLCLKGDKIIEMTTGKSRKYCLRTRREYMSILLV